MLTLAWVEQQIDDAINGKNEPQNVRDYALLCIARDNLKAAQAASSVSTAYSATKQQRVVLTDYSADLDKVPRLEEIDAAINAAATAACTPKDQQHVRDQQTWAQILGQK